MLIGLNHFYCLISPYINQRCFTMTSENNGAPYGTLDMLDVAHVNSIINVTCGKLNVQIHSSMWRRIIPLHVQNNVVVAVIPYANHNSLSIKTPYEIINNIANNPLEMNSLHAQEIGNDMQMMAIYKTKVKEMCKFVTFL